MESRFEIPNETATVEKARLKQMTRDYLVKQLELSLNIATTRTRTLPFTKVIQCRPFSANKMSGRRKTYETKEYLAFRDLIAKALGGNYGIVKTDNLKLTITAGFSNKRGDLDNVFKPLLDSMVACMDAEFDDCQIYEIEANKVLVKKGQEFIEVGLSIIK